MENIQRYPTGNRCHHCVWLEEKPWRWEGEKVSIRKPVWVLRPKKNFLGVSVFDSHKKLENSFISVYGSKGENSAYYHQFWNLGELLMGSVYFIEELHLEYGIENVQLIISSNFDPKKHGRKEHPHAIITLPDLTSDQYKKVFGEKPVSGSGAVPVLRNPYPTDTVYSLTEEQSSTLIRSGRGAYAWILSFLREKLHTDFLPTDSFYLFMDFSCSKKGEKMCGVIRARLATDKKEKSE